VVAWSKAWTVLARSNNGVMGSNPNQGTDICVRLFCVCVVLCVGTALRRESYRLCIGLSKWKSSQGPKGCRAMKRERERYELLDWFLFCSVFDVVLQGVIAYIAEKLTAFQMATKLSTLYGTRNFIPLSISLTQDPTPYSCKIHFNIIHL
jgi:hypothetical protein